MCGCWCVGVRVWVWVWMGFRRKENWPGRLCSGRGRRLVFPSPKTTHSLSLGGGLANLLWPSAELALACL